MSIFRLFKLLVFILPKKKSWKNGLFAPKLWVNPFGQMSGKSKASDRTNLGTSAAPINCQYNPVKLKFTILLFFKKNSRFMKIIRHQIPMIQDPSPVKMAFKTVIRSLVWPTAVRKLFLISQNNRVFFASAFLSVQFKSNTEYSVYSVFYNIPCIPPFPRIGSPNDRGGHHKKRQETGRIFKSMKVPHSFCKFIL